MSNDTVRIARKTYYTMLMLNTFKIAGLFFFITFVVYFCFASTIIRFVFTDPPGAILVKNPTYEGNIAKPGDMIVVNTEKTQGTSTLSRIKQGFAISKDVATVEVVTGPHQWVLIDNGVAIIDGQKVESNVLFDGTFNNYLDNSYLVRCSSGSCETGKSFIVSANNIYGQPLNP